MDNDFLSKKTSETPVQDVGAVVSSLDSSVDDDKTENNFLDKYTAFLRKQYLFNFKKTVVVWSALLVFSILGCIVFDSLVPFTPWGVIVRSFLVLGVAFVFFSFGYLATFFYTMILRSQYDNVFTLKDRFSPAWRRRISIVLGVFLFSMTITITKGPMYSIVSALILSGGVGIFMFMSLTEVEKEREFFGVPDRRDAPYNAALEEIRLRKKTREKTVD